MPSPFHSKSTWLPSPVLSSLERAQHSSKEHPSARPECSERARLAHRDDPLPDSVEEARRHVISPAIWVFEWGTAPYRRR